MIHRISKKQIADAQLYSAIDRYLAKDYIPAVTLAGAAEEIYSSFIKMSRAGMLGKKVKTSLGLYLLFCRIRGTKEKKSYLVARANMIRNEFKHHGRGNREWVRVDLVVAATVAIHRSLENYFRIGGVRNSLIIKYIQKSSDVG